MSYYLAPSLEVLRSEINARWPGRDRTSDGWIGDLAHQATRSDHNPNSRGSVDALDVDRDGVDMTAIIAAFQRHPSAHYWIYRGQIADRDDGWRRRTYTGSNPHDKHAHFSIRQTRTAEQDRRPWGLLEDDMPLTDADQPVIKAAVHSTPIGRTGVTFGAVMDQMRQLPAQVKALQAAVTALAESRPDVDTATVLARMDALAAEERQRDEQAAAERAELADLVRQQQTGELTAEQVVDELARRLAADPTAQG